MRSSNNFSFSNGNKQEIDEKIGQYDEEYKIKYLEKFIDQNLRQSDKSCNKELENLWSRVIEKRLLLGAVDAYNIKNIDRFEADFQSLLEKFNESGENQHGPCMMDNLLSFLSARIAKVWTAAAKNE